MEKPFILVVGFFFHITIAINEGWLAPRYLIFDYSTFYNHPKIQSPYSHLRLRLLY